jgi:hypothetical protein
MTSGDSRRWLSTICAVKPRVRPSKVKPARIRTEKLSVKTLIPGAALPKIAKVKVTIKLTAMIGAAIWRATRKILPVWTTKNSATLWVKVGMPSGATSKLRRKARMTAWWQFERKKRTMAR